MLVHGFDQAARGNNDGNDNFDGHGSSWVVGTPIVSHYPQAKPPKPWVFSVAFRVNGQNIN